YSCHLYPSSLHLRIFSSFFFPCYPPHRPLHSFPTRRSSDLTARVRCLHIRDVRRRLPPIVLVDEEETGLSILHRREQSAATDAEDRKSTRLNSSHDQISYAVFCLKKKKKKNI